MSSPDCLQLDALIKKSRTRVDTMLNLNLELKESTSQKPSREESPPELSIVMPCLNEAETLGTCINKAQRALRENNIAGEIIIADNGSTDGSQSIAVSLGARVVHVEKKGYGNALMGGI